MSKFVIECPKCRNYAEASTGLFAKRKIQCACGNTIDVRTEKLATRKCPKCGNTVIYDQSKGEKALCPVCHEPINTTALQLKTVEFSCAQCGIQLHASKADPVCVCPVCGCENNVEQRAVTEKIKKDGLASIIKYEGDNETLVWKHPIEDFNFGSQLIVHESQEAIFFRDGQALDLFGAGRYTLQTQQLPLLEKIYKLPTDTEGTFHSEVYFVNLATQMGVKWGTDSKVRLFDPASGLHIEIGASGEFNIRVTDSRKLLLKVVGTTGGLGQEQLLGIGNGKGFFRSMVMTQVKSYLAQTIKENTINILEIDEHLMALSGALRERINAALDEYGLTMPEFYVSRIVTPDDDPNFRRMKEQYAEQYLLVRQEELKTMPFGEVWAEYCRRCGKFYGVEAVANSTGIPRCTCGGVIKPDVVLYEESLDEQVMDKALDYIAHADVLIIGGTSLVVYPAAGLVRYYRGSKLVVINKDATGIDSSADLCINAPIGQVLSQL